MNNTELFLDYPDVVTVNDVVKMLRVGRTTAYELVKKNKIKNVKKIGDRYRIPKRSVIEYLLNN